MGKQTERRLVIRGGYWRPPPAPAARESKAPAKPTGGATRSVTASELVERNEGARFVGGLSRSSGFQARRGVGLSGVPQRTAPIRPHKPLGPISSVIIRRGYSARPDPSHGLLPLHGPVTFEDHIRHIIAPYRRSADARPSLIKPYLIQPLRSLIEETN